MLTSEKISEYLDLPLSISVYDSLDSTNLFAKELAETRGIREMCIIARSQNGGRGRMGRSFFSPFGGLYMSLILRGTQRADAALKITTTAAVAVSRAIEAVSGEAAAIKWVNDVYLKGKKVCGILTEAKTLPDGMLDYAILGIGVNLIEPKDKFPADIADRAGAIFKTLPENAENMLAASIINEFRRLMCEGNEDECLNEYRARSFIIGKTIDVLTIDGTTEKSARVVGIDDNYRLIIEYENGQTDSLSSGEVSIKV